MAVSLTSMIMTDGWLFHCELCYVEGSFFRLSVGSETSSCILFVRPVWGSNRNIMPFTFSGWGSYRLIVFGMMSAIFSLLLMG